MAAEDQVSGRVELPETTAQERADYERHRRVEELIAALAGPTFRWQMANGMAGRFGRSGGTSTVPTHVEVAQRRSARTRRTNAERDVEAAVAAWWLKHPDVGAGE